MDEKPKLTVIDGGKKDNEPEEEISFRFPDGYSQPPFVKAEEALGPEIKPFLEQIKQAERKGEAVKLPASLGMGEIVATDEVEEVQETSMEKVTAVHAVDPMKIPVMRCGHMANSSTLFRNKASGEFFREFSCVLCVELLPMTKALCGPHGEPLLVIREDLKGRKAVCKCKKEIPSDTPGITFFLHQPKQEKDVFYCGHNGWDPRLCRRMVQTPAMRSQDIANSALHGNRKKRRKK